MTIIVVPTERCNHKCTYCFETQRVHDGVGIEYNYDAMKQSLEEIWGGRYHHSGVCLHGGECTLIPVDEFEKLVSMIYNLPWRRQDQSVGKKGAVSIVTNGSNITDRHIEIFKKYNVHVSISVDGPPELNVYRGPCPDCEGVSAKYNEELRETILRLRQSEVPVSIMCILHQGNAGSKEKRMKLGKWMIWLKEYGITGGRMNPAYSDEHPELELTNDQIFQMWVNIYHWNKKYGLRWNPLMEMERNLLGDNKNPQPCVYNKCDPFNTHTISVLPDGRIGNCDRTFGRGIYMRSMDNSTSGRYKALKQTDCKKCKYWAICHGGCPQEGVDGDWRRNTRFCQAIYKTYNYIEKQLRKQGKQVIITGSMDEPMFIPPETHGDMPHGDAHGDAPHGDSTHGDETHGDMPHGDVPHGDSDHGDAVDWRD